MTEKLHSFDFFLGVIVTSLKITNKELVLNEGETAVFDCVVEANTAVKIHWTRGSQVITMVIVLMLLLFFHLKSYNHATGHNAFFCLQIYTIILI